MRVLNEETYVNISGLSVGLRRWKPVVPQDLFIPVFTILTSPTPIIKDLGFRV